MRSTRAPARTRTSRIHTCRAGARVSSCKFCHRTDIRDYASDEIRKKVIARRMMQMVERINRELFTWKDAPRATCFMCHRGKTRPQTRLP